MSLEPFVNEVPLPPPIPTNNFTDQHNRGSKKKKSFELSECVWAENFPLIQRTFFLAKVCLYNPPISCKYLDINPILQTGPTCGLLAISMLFNGKPELKELLEDARKRKFTCLGEMFSAENMLELLDQNIKKSNVIRDETKYIQVLYKRSLNSLVVKEALINGAALLVPYPFYYSNQFYSDYQF